MRNRSALFRAAVILTALVTLGGCNIISSLLGGGTTSSGEASLTVYPTSFSIGVGQPQTVTVQAKDSSGKTSSFNIGSYNTSIVSVGNYTSSSFTVTGLSAGTAQIIVQNSAGGPSQTVYATVGGGTGGISVGETNVTMSPNSSYTVSVTPTTGVSASSTNPSIVSAYVNGGLVVLNSASVSGNATVNVWNSSGGTAQINVTVSSSGGASLTLGMTSVNVAAGGTQFVSVTAVNNYGGTDTFYAQSQNTYIATAYADSLGITVEGRNSGNTQVIVTSGSGKSMSLYVNVTAGSLASPQVQAPMLDYSTATPRVMLYWYDVAGASNYEIERANTNDWIFTGIGITYFGTPQFADSGVVAGSSYVYRIRAVAGSTGPWTETSSIYVEATVVDYPTTAPTNFGGNSNVYEVNLYWDYVPKASYYEIERKDMFGYTTILTSNYTSFTDFDLSPGTNYWYRVRGVKGATDPAYWSAEFYIMTKALDVALLPAPTIYTDASYDNVQLSWSYISGASYYRIEKWNSASYTYDLLAEVSGTSYADWSVSSNAYYEYRVAGVQVVDGSGVVGNFNYAGLYTDVNPNTQPPAETPPIHSYYGTGTTTAYVGWYAVPAAAWYEVSYGTDYYNVLYDNGASTATVYTTYIDLSGLGSGSYNYLKVRAANVNGAGPWTGIYAVSTYTTMYEPAVPSAPYVSGKGYSIANSSIFVDIAWQYVDYASFYIIERSADGGTSWGSLGTPTSTTYRDFDILSDVTYQYRVRAANDSYPNPTGYSGSVSYAVPVMMSVEIGIH